MTHVVVDLECGSRHSRRPSSAASDGEGDSICFSDADDSASCYSQFYSTYDGSYDDQSSFDHEIGQVSDSRRVSSVAGSDCSVDIESGAHELKLHLGKEDRDCRICHMSLTDDESVDNGVAMELGCSCKDDLAVAHKHCAETWFKIKGNKTCEICNSIARNIIGINETASTTQHANETNAVATTAATSAFVSPVTDNSRSCLNGHRFLNFLLACMVFAFVISWLFHFNIPS